MAIYSQQQKSRRISPCNRLFQYQILYIIKVTKIILSQTFIIITYVDLNDQSVLGNGLHPHVLNNLTNDDVG